MVIVNSPELVEEFRFHHFDKSLAPHLLEMLQTPAAGHVLYDKRAMRGQLCLGDSGQK